jgi:hypothetical protein
MRISKPTIQKSGETVQISVTVTRGQREDILWYSVPHQWGEALSTESSDGFLVALLHLAMISGERLEVDGAISEKLFHNLVFFYMPMIAQSLPGLKPVPVIPNKLKVSHASGNAVAAGFSGGIDSFAMMVDHFLNERIPHYKITHLLFNNVGSHGKLGADKARKLFLDRYEKIRGFVEDMNIPFIRVDSNIDEFIQLPFIKIHSSLNASVPLILQNLIGKFYYSAAHKYEDCRVAPAADIALLDPMAVHLYSTEMLDCISTGCQYSRVEKTRLVSQFKPSYLWLNVCTDAHGNGSNCSVCPKCCRTLLTLELLNAIHLYEWVFDLKRYRQVRRKYIQEQVLHAKEGSLEYEIVHLARGVCTERWGDILRLRQAQKEAIRKVRDFLRKVRDKLRTVMGRELFSRSRTLAKSALNSSACMVFKRSLKKIIYHRRIHALWYTGRTNWGDGLNPILIEGLSGRKVRYDTDPGLDKYMVIGSVLAHADEHTVVWGAGFLKEGQSVLGPPKAVHALRGPLSRKRLQECGIEAPEVYGDPALLLPRLYNPEISKTHEVGLIAHHADKGHPWLERYRRDPKVRIVDIQTDTYRFVQEVKSCELIISSSLHGIICADAYGIPALWMELSDRVIGKGFKFFDYFSSIGREVSAPVAPHEKMLLAQVVAAYRSYRVRIDLDRLLSACPFLRPSIRNTLNL